MDRSARANLDKLIESTTTLSEARQLVEDFRSRTLAELARALTGDSEPKPALRTALHGWLGWVVLTSPWPRNSWIERMGCPLAAMRAPNV
jgi:hypothetical protein